MINDFRPAARQCLRKSGAGHIHRDKWINVGVLDGQRTGWPQAGGDLAGGSTALAFSIMLGKQHADPGKPAGVLLGGQPEAGFRM